MKRQMGTAVAFISIAFLLGTAVVGCEKETTTTVPVTAVGRHISDVASPSAPGSCLGSFDSASSVAVQGGTNVRGWAWSTREKKTPSQILLVDDAGIVVGLASSGIERPDVVGAIPEIKDKMTGWQGYAKEGRKVSAYAIIEGGREACELSGSFDIVPGAPDLTVRPTGGP